MLKIITSVVLSLVTIMAVTLFAVTVPAQSQKIEDNAAAIVKAQTDAENNAYNKVKEDILSDMSGTTLEDVGTAISALQDDVAVLEDKHIYEHTITLAADNALLHLNFPSKTKDYSLDAFIEYLEENEFISESEVVVAAGRVYYGSSSSSQVSGIYTSNDDIYAIVISSTTPNVTGSYLLENLSLTDISILLN